MKPEGSFSARSPFKFQSKLIKYSFLKYLFPSKERRTLDAQIAFRLHRRFRNLIFASGDKGPLQFSYFGFCQSRDSSRLEHADILNWQLYTQNGEAQQEWRKEVSCVGRNGTLGWSYNEIHSPLLLHCSAICSFYSRGRDWKPEIPARRSRHCMFPNT